LLSALTGLLRLLAWLVLLATLAALTTLSALLTALAALLAALVVLVHEILPGFSHPTHINVQLGNRLLRRLPDSHSNGVRSLAHNTLERSDIELALYRGKPYKPHGHAALRARRLQDILAGFWIRMRLRHSSTPLLTGGSAIGSQAPTPGLRPLSAMHQNVNSREKITSVKREGAKIKASHLTYSFVGQSVLGGLLKL
jgi:hypothetical protein